MQLLAYETIEHHALLSRDNACPKSHVLVNELSESFNSVCLMANPKGLRNGKASVSVKPLFTQIAKVPGC